MLPPLYLRESEDRRERDERAIELIRKAKRRALAEEARQREEEQRSREGPAIEPVMPAWARAMAEWPTPRRRGRYLPERYIPERPIPPQEPLPEFAGLTVEEIAAALQQDYTRLRSISVNDEAFLELAKVAIQADYRALTYCSSVPWWDYIDLAVLAARQNRDAVLIMRDHPLIVREVWDRLDPERGHAYVGRGATQMLWERLDPDRVSNSGSDWDFNFDSNSDSDWE